MEHELKLIPDDPTLLERLQELDSLGPFAVHSRRHEAQRNTFFDTSNGALAEAGLALRRRVIAGRRLATWALKGEGTLERGVALRAEIELHLEEETSPALVVGALGQAARERGNAALAEQLADALAHASPPVVKPFLELETDRRLFEIVAPERGWKAELALDRIRLAQHPGFAEQEIEVELHRGTADVLEAARAAIEALGAAHPATQSKLARALAHVRSHDPGVACG